MTIKTNGIYIHSKSLVEKCVTIHYQSIYSTTFSRFSKLFHTASFFNSLFDIFSCHVFSA
nr:MAG TPA: hypothetical protein [Caudoviricetes sp.]